MHCIQDVNNKVCVAKEAKVYYEMNFEAPALTWMPSPTQQTVVTLTFHLHNLIRSSAGASEYSL